MADYVFEGVFQVKAFDLIWWFRLEGLSGLVWVGEIGMGKGGLDFFRIAWCFKESTRYCVIVEPIQAGTEGSSLYPYFSHLRGID